MIFFCLLIYLLGHLLEVLGLADLRALAEAPGLLVLGVVDTILVNPILSNIALCIRGFLYGYSDLPVSSKTSISFELICVNI